MESANRRIAWGSSMIQKFDRLIYFVLLRVPSPTRRGPHMEPQISVDEDESASVTLDKNEMSTYRWLYFSQSIWENECRRQGE